MLNKLKPKSEFSRNVLTLMTGTTIAQAIPIAISPILTRIYTPEDFGVFALYMSIASILSVLATGRYELAIMLPKKDEDAVNIVALSIIISFFVSFIALLLVYFFNAQITSLLGNPEISSWLYFIPITVLLTGIYQSFNYWSNRKKQYKRLAMSRVVQSGTTASTNLGMGFGGFGSSGLILGGVLGQSIATSALGSMILKEDRFRVKNISKLKVFALAKKYIKFPKYNTQHVLINTVFSQMPIFILAKYFNSTIVGFYALSIRMIQAPIVILGNSLATVLYEKIVNLKNQNQKYMFQVYKFLKYQILLSIILFSILFILSDYIDIIFGDSWETVGLYIKLLIPWLVMVFIVSPLAFAINMTDNQEKGLKLEWLYGGIKFTSLLVGAVYFNDIKITLGLFSFSNLIFLIFQGIWFIKLLKEGER